jgi:NADH-quinone oxidoreductase subunit L
MLNTIWLIPVFPLVGFIINGLFGRRLTRYGSGVLGCITVFFSFLFSLLAILFLGDDTFRFKLVDWVVAGTFTVSFGFLLDPLSAVMALTVSGVAFLIHVYSTGYMAHDKHFSRYFAYLNLFVFFMLILVLADNFLLLYMGWEGVGLCSYLLIGFWFQKDSAANAGKKAFIVNRIGDFGFALGIMLIFWKFGSMYFSDVFAAAPETFVSGDTTVTVICLLLFLGAAGKSAQIPLYVWLPDAMEGPTPVSALIHAATMVTAGVYMIARCAVLFTLSPVALFVVAIIGAATALFAATMATVQNDIKRVLAYSTISQLGYMFLACGVAAFSAAIFHLMTHAFFKALLFLSAGSVIHALHEEHDLRNMGGLRRYLPATFLTFGAATLAITGFPGLAGFVSKDEILWSSFSSPLGGPVFWIVGVITAGLTAFYMFRLFFLAFYGKPRFSTETAAKVHESPMSMTGPLVILGILSVVGGWIGWPEVLGGGNVIGHYLGTVFAGARELLPHGEHHAHSTEYLLMALSVGIALMGFLWAYRWYLKGSTAPENLKTRFPALYRLVLNKYYVDEFYHAVVIRPIVGGSRWLWKYFDDLIIDGSVNGLARLVRQLGRAGARSQTGYFREYAAVFSLGCVVLLAWLIYVMS